MNPETNARDAQALERVTAAHATGGRILFRGATIVSMDREVGDFDRGDLLVENGAIAAVGADLSDAAADGQAVVVDATGTVMIPGLVDGHRHCWQSQFRRIIVDIALDEYITVMHRELALAYEPEDMYAGTLLAATGAIDAGITSVLDFAHNARSPEHQTQAVSAWRDSGVRAVFGSAVPMFGEWNKAFREDVTRLRSEYFASDDALMTLRLAVAPKVLPDVAGDLSFTSSTAEFARDLGIGLTLDAVFGPEVGEEIVALEREGLLGDDLTWIHCNELGDEAWKALAASGGRVVLATTSDEQLGCGGGRPPIQEALDNGIMPALSIDVECSLTTDMFTQMQVTLNTQRMQSFQAEMRGEETVPERIAVKDALAFATIGGAKANGVWDRCGSLTPGKRADLVLIGAEDLNNMPLNNAVATVVLGAETRNVDTVLVDGAPRKWGGKLVGVDEAHLRRIVTESRDRLLERIGRELRVTADAPRFMELA